MMRKGITSLYGEVSNHCVVDTVYEIKIPSILMDVPTEVRHPQSPNTGD
jgi:hypothetical protein